MSNLSETASMPSAPAAQFAPVAVTHLADSIAQLFGVHAKRRSNIEIYSAAQPNSHPHLGGVTTLFSAFAVARHLKIRYNMPTVVIFDSLENSPGQSKVVAGEEWQLSVADTPAPEDPSSSMAETYLQSFRWLLQWVSVRSGIPYRFRSYSEFCLLHSFRRAVMHMAARQDYFVDILAPRDRRLHIRAFCPECRWTPKTADQISGSSTEMTLKLNCVEHGAYNVSVTENNHSIFDTNTAVRSVAKQVVLAERANERNSICVMVDGADWSGTWALSIDAYAAVELGIPFAALPLRLFPPTILDESGAKFSKSIYVRGDTYQSVPEAFLNFSMFLAQHGELGVEKIFRECMRWTDDPRRFFRDYSLSYFERIVSEEAPLS